MNILLKLVSVFVFFLVGAVTMLSACIVLTMLFLGLQNHIDIYIRKWAKLLLWLGRAQLEVTGLENIPKGPCVFIFNHISIIDIPALFFALPRSIRFGAKTELFKIPIFGLALRRLGILEIDRGDRPKAIKTLQLAGEKIRSGQAYIFAAEGTRQNEDAIGEFKTGPFILAIESKVPLVPVVISGAMDVLSKNELLFHLEKNHVVHVEVLKPIETASCDLNKRQELKGMTRNLMVNSFEKLKKSRLMD